MSSLFLPDAPPFPGDRALGNYLPAPENLLFNHGVVPLRRGLRRVLGRSGIVPVGRGELPAVSSGFIPAAGEIIPERGQ